MSSERAVKDKDAERGDVEDALQKAQNQLRDIVEHAGILMCGHDLSGTIVSINDVASRSLGYASRDLVGTSIRDLLEPGRQPDFDRYLEEIQRARTATGFMSVVTRTGETRYWNYQNRLSDDAGKPMVYGTAIDVTDRFRAEAAATMYARRQAAILDALPAQIALLGEDATILAVNTAWSRAAQENGADVTIGGGVDYASVCGPAHGMSSENAREVVAAIRDVLSGKRDDYSAEYACGAPDRPKWFRLLVSPVRSGGIRGAVVMHVDRSEQQKAEEDLQRQAMIFENMYDAVTIADVKETVVDWNPGAERMYGISRSAAIGENISILAPTPEEKDKTRQVAEIALREGRWSGERFFRRPDGTPGVRELVVLALRDSSGNLVGTAGISRDISERKEAERALQESETKYRKIVDLAPVGIYQSTPDGRLLTCNDAFAKMFGYDSAREMLAIGTTTVLFASAEERAAAIAPHLAAGGAENVEFHLYRKDRSRVWVQNTAHVVKNARGEIDCVEGFVIDISERKRVEGQQARLQADVLDSARQWRDTFDAIEAPVLIVDSAGIVKRLNRAASQLAGRTYLEILGVSIDEVAAGEPWHRGRQLIREMVDGSLVPNAFCRDEATRQTWELSVSRFEDSSGNNPLFILVARNITPLVELQESVMKAQSMSAMGALVAGVAHEVRNPLFAISATLDAFDLRFQDREDYKKYAHALRMQLDRMNNLMHDLLDYGKPVAYETRDVPVGEIVGEAIRICCDQAAARQLRLEYAGDETLPPARVDRARTVQVFVNLIENAIQHSPSGGLVRVRVEMAADRRSIAAAVEDSGTGFRPDDLPRLFEPFFTRRQGGTGLGLAIVRRIVTEQGGAVLPSNRREGGAIVTVTLPTARESGDTAIARHEMGT